MFSLGFSRYPSTKHSATDNSKVASIDDMVVLKKQKIRGCAQMALQFRVSPAPTSFRLCQCSTSAEMTFLFMTSTFET